MTLKDSFQYQNYLEQMLTQVRVDLETSGNVMKVTEYHMRSKVREDAQDEVIDATSERDFACTPNDLIDVMMALLDEKIAVTKAIGDAKHSWFALDAEIAANRNRRQVCGVLSTLSARKPKELMGTGSALCFNVNGEPVSYNYDVKTVKTIDYDRNKVKELYRNLMTESQKISNEADNYCLHCTVDFEPRFAVVDTIDDVIDKVLNTKTA